MKSKIRQLENISITECVLSILLSVIHNEPNNMLLIKKSGLLVLFVHLVRMSEEVAKNGDEYGRKRIGWNAREKWMDGVKKDVQKMQALEGWQQPAEDSECWRAF